MDDKRLAEIRMRHDVDTARAHASGIPSVAPMVAHQDRAELLIEIAHLRMKNRALLEENTEIRLAVLSGMKELCKTIPEAT